MQAGPSCVEDGESLFLQGRETKDKENAKALFQKAVLKGHVKAMRHLGSMYLKSGDISENIKVKPLVEMAVEKGDIPSINLLAFVYHHGIGVARDIDKAVQLYREAISKGVTAAMVNLGSMFKNGDGVARDMNKAIELYEGAISNGNVEAMKILGLILERGDGVPQNLARSLELHNQAAEQGNKVSERHRDSLKGRITPIRADDPSPSTQPAPPSSNGRLRFVREFEVQEELGCGSSGKVYLVKRRSAEKEHTFALKVIPTHTDEKLIEALNEVSSGGVFQHASIVRTLDYFVVSLPVLSGGGGGGGGDHDGIGERVPHTCILMELCERDLHEEIVRMIDGDRWHEERTVWRWLHQVCSALEYLHSKHVIHRDIKPDNMMLTRENPPSMKVADFGISRKLEINGTTTTPIGSERYAAPDIASSYDTSIDMWGIGVTFLELLTREVIINRADVQKGRISMSQSRGKQGINIPFRRRVSGNPRFVEESCEKIEQNGYSRDLAQLVSGLMSTNRQTASQVVEFIDNRNRSLSCSLQQTLLSESIHWRKKIHISQREVRLLKEIGRGTSGVVWLGEWIGRGGGLQIAVKLPVCWKEEDSFCGIQESAQSAVQKQIMAEFKVEMKILEGLRHKHVVWMFGVCGDSRWIVEEHAERGSLHDVLHNPSIGLEWRLRWRMAKQVTMGLNYLHHFDPVILHRDLKSFNILVDDRWDVKICDFGMALMGSSADDRCSSDLRNQAAAMQWRWSAPEIINTNSTNRTAKWSTQSDIFSLGMVMWELSSRQIPFHEILDAEQRLPREDDLRPDIAPECPESLAELIRQCWRTNPEHRPSCDDILDFMNRHNNEFLQ